jgi:hypothetical protein
MATVIDSLIVTLGLDASKFTKGQKDAAAALVKTRQEANTTAKDMEARGKQIAEGFARVRNSAISLLAVFTAGRGLTSFIAETTATSAAVGRLSVNLGMSANQLSAWQGAAQRFGGSAEGLAGSFRAISQDIEGFALTGQSQVIPILNRLGIAVTDSARRARPLGEMFLDLADTFKGMSAQRASFVGGQLGLDQGTVNLLMQGRSAVQAHLARQAELGTVTEGQAQAAIRRQQAWLDFTQAFETSGRKLLTELTPAITNVLAELTKLATYLSGPDFAPWFKALGDKVKDFAQYLGGSGFRSDLDAFGKGIRDVTHALLEAMYFLGIMQRPREVWSIPTGGDPNSGLPGTPRRGTLRGAGAAGGFYGGADGALDPGALRDRFARDLGITPDQAAGIVSGLHAESGLRPGITRPGGLDFGLAQWVGPRRAALERFAAERGTTREDADTQIAFIQHELRTSHAGVLARIRASRTPTEAGRAFHDYEAGGAAQFEHLRDWHAGQADSFSRAPVDPALRTRGLFSPRGAGGGGSSTATTTIGPITINVPSGDPNAIASSIGDRLQRYGFVPMANTGLA